ncbi:xanthine dehydrogenase family protein molybdopterin-binding subunit [Aquibium microcysteis]|uniref:xanthine dehydrogenase family protein molybdopterin-binding subunit n=1 Tax=Aquibium microcysteis TaxID=675281 RepID=UPI00165D11AA|nr:molybdopterin cofactor-binding domain-containing protein [Aquibium microcysteis]
MSTLSRRRFLIALGWGAAGITAVAGGAAWALMPTLPPRNAPTHADAAAWLSLRPDGVFELYSSRAEMGQGISMGLRQVAADELGVGVDRVRLVQPDTSLVPVARSTVGSDAMRETGVLVARSAAALASAVLREAAHRLGRPVADLQLASDGVVSGTETVLTFAELGIGAPLLVSAEDVETGSPRLLAGLDGRREVGRAHPTEDIDAIVTGSRPLYADDIRLPGMVFGSVVRPQTLGGRILGIDASACRSVTGFIGLYRDSDFAGLVASRRGALAQAMSVLVVEETEGPDTDSDAVAAMVHFRSTTPALEHSVVDSGIANDEPFDVDLTLTVPLAAHASIEPRTAVARFDENGGLEVWTGTQDPFFVRNSLADAFGLSRDRVVVHGMRIGGGFGGRTIVAAEMDAARLAKLCGHPVKVQWSRSDEFRAGFHRHPSSHRLRLSADASGRIIHWHHAFRSGHVIFTSAAMGPGLQFATSFVADPGVARGSVPPYAAAATRVEFEDVRLPVKTGPWRGLGAAANSWAVETAIDALARAKGIDPLDMRLRSIAPQHARLSVALSAAAEMAGWTSRPKDSPHEGWGLACGIYKDMSYAAAVARVTRSEAGYKVTGLWCAHDCGLVVNPDQVRAQVEGNLVWGIGMALKEDLLVDGGRILPESFFDYPLPLLSDVPQIEIRVIEGSAAPTGAGETAMVCGTAAVTNAIAAMTGQTVTTLPVRAA